jgi:maleamate amidohydrolase
MGLATEELRELVDPAHTALIVIDKQYGYFQREGVQTTDLLSKVDGIESFILKARSKEVAIYWTQMLENIDDSPSNIQYVMQHQDGYVELTRQGRQSFEFFGDVTPEANEEVITKKRYNAFAHTKLAKLLKDRGIKTVILVGGYGSRCVLASIVGAVDEGFRVVVPRQLIGNTDVTMDEIPATLSVIKSIYGFVVDTDEIYATWGI